VHLEQDTRDKIRESVEACVRASRCDENDIIFIVPPFASPDWPSLGVHILSGLAQGAGFKSCVVYANLSFARFVGPLLYRELCVTSTGELVGERLFRRAYSKTSAIPGAIPESWSNLRKGSPPDFESVQVQAAHWADLFAEALANSPSKVIGFSTTFEQTLVSLSIIERLKALAPDKRLLLGGANADGEMGPALKRFEPAIDHVFVGESEASFTRFLSELRAGQADIDPEFQGENNDRLDQLPAPDYEDFFTQFHALVTKSACADGLSPSHLRLPYESSRGCWWGAKHHCTFCGLNANGMTHRIKCADKVFKDLHSMSEKHGVDEVIMVDNIMPHTYFSTLLPQLIQHEKTLSIFYEQKSNISLSKMKSLSSAGIRSIQPGIESISTGLLKLMSKGVSARTNVDCMRYARSCGVDIVWNVLVDFPGDQESSYQDMIDLMPLLHHLAPPTGLSHISIDRFSPYHFDPDKYGVSNLRPIAVYDELFPGGDLDALAYHFRGDYESAARRRPDLVEALDVEADRWIKVWDAEAKPLLNIFELNDERFLLVDTRKISSRDPQLLDRQAATLLLTGATELSPQVSRFLDAGHLAEIDGVYAALCCAAPDVAAWTKAEAAVAELM
jgi:ribosomal peptide maturation radical SAM protein 1